MDKICYKCGNFAIFLRPNGNVESCEILQNTDKVTDSCPFYIKDEDNMIS